MFNKLFRRNRNAVVVDMDQLHLDILRTSFANVPMMQLHLDRMQTALSRTR